jgi:hypothetical protein
MEKRCLSSISQWTPLVGFICVVAYQGKEISIRESDVYPTIDQSAKPKDAMSDIHDDIRSAGIECMCP